MTFIERLPKPLVKDLVDGICFPIIGAGFSKNAKVPKGQSMPLWEDLGKSLAKQLNIHNYSTAIDAISAFEYKCGRTALIETLRDMLLIDLAEPGDVHKAFCRIPFNMVCTTNFDGLLEKAYTAVGKKFQVKINEKDLPISVPKNATVLLKLHGDINQPDTLVMTEADYEAYIVKKPLVVNVFTNQLIQNTPLLIGYSASDDDFRQVWMLVQRGLGDLTRNAYAITVRASEEEKEQFERRKIKVINFEEDALSYQQLLEELFN